MDLADGWRAAAPSWAEVVAAAERHRLGAIELTMISDDSRQVRPGTLFVAHGGARADGHAYIPQAVDQGAALIVAEHPLPAPVPVCVVADGRRALSRLAAAWCGYPARRLRMVGVTGTNGKTTTVQLVAAILAAAGYRPCLVGTLGFQRRPGERAAPLPWTTPPPVALHAWLAQEAHSGADACVMEVSAQSISQERVSDCDFDVAAITNLTRDHGEYYNSAEAYARAKARLFRDLEHAGKPARAVLYSELSYRSLFAEACRVPVLEFGPGAAVCALEVRPRGLDGTDLVLRLPGRPDGLAVRLRLPGQYNVDNALCAAAIGSALGLDAEAISAGLGAVRSVPGRLQPVAEGEVRILVDYAHNPAGLRVVLRLLRDATAGQLVVVMGARGQRDRGKRFTMGCVAAAFADMVVLTSDRPAGEDPEVAADLMRMAIMDCGVPVTFIADRFQALARALEGRRPGDCVVAVGKGEEEWAGDSPRRELNDVSALRALGAAELAGRPGP